MVEFSCSSKRVTRQGTIDNFKRNEEQIRELSGYFLKLKTDSNEIFFEPHSNRYTISIGLPNWAVDPDHPYKVGRDIKLKSAEMDTFLKALGWTTNTVLILKDMLNKANCESISSQGDCLQLNYATDDICSFYYFVLNKPFADSTIEKDTKAGITFLRNNVRIGSSCVL